MSTTQNFDAIGDGGFPADWSKWATLGAANVNVQSQKLRLADRYTFAYISAAVSADQEVSADVYVPGLTNIGVFVRGSNLTTTSRTCYAVTVTRGNGGPLLILWKIVNNVGTQLTSTACTGGYLSTFSGTIDFWASGTTLKAKFRRDNGLYLNSAGSWQSGSCWAISITDASIGGTTGLAGTIKWDNYALQPTVDNVTWGEAVGDSTPPTCTLTSPLDGASVTGNMTMTATATDNVAVDRVEFFADGTLRATIYASPYTSTLNSVVLANGSHLIHAKAVDTSENSTLSATATIVVTNDTAVVRPTLTRKKKCGLVQLFYGVASIVATNGTTIVRDYADIIVCNAAQAQEAKVIDAAIQTLLYSNVSNTYTDNMLDLLAYFDDQGWGRETPFYHVKAATAYYGASPSSRYVEQFWQFWSGNPASLSRMYLPAALPNTVGHCMAIGYDEKFREIRWAFSTPATGGTRVVEYPTAKDASGIASAWSTLSVSDGTSGMTANGSMVFDPPADWISCKVSSTSYRLLWVRVRVSAAATVAPVMSSILCTDYTSGGSSGYSGTIPAFDYAADLDGDGYLNDTEYAARAAGKDARFAYQGRALTPNYGQKRYPTRPDDPHFVSYITQYHVALVGGLSYYNGIMMDNTIPTSYVAEGTVVETVGDFAAANGALVNAVWRAIDTNVDGSKWVLPNTGAMYSQIITALVPAWIGEFWFRPQGPLTHWQVWETQIAQVAVAQATTVPEPIGVVDTHPQGSAGATDTRFQMGGLAMFYQVMTPGLRLMIDGGNDPSITSAADWLKHWFQALDYDPGDALGAVTLAASGSEPGSGYPYRIYAREFANAVVLYRPRSYQDSSHVGGIDDTTAVTYNLGFTGKVLAADNTQGAPVTSVSIRGGEGMVVVRTVAQEDTTPPTPNPATWATVPTPVSDSSITMTATTGSDPNGVQYSFDATDGGHDSGWLEVPTYTDTGLAGATTYNYRVSMRDKSANANQGTWSSTLSATTYNPPDTSPPTPDPATWDTEPYAVDHHSIAMVATTATDPSGVEYRFTESTGNGHSSAWQDSPSYTDADIAAGTTCTYRVQTRDKDASQNTGTVSVARSATTTAMEESLIQQICDAVWQAAARSLLVGSPLSPSTPTETVCNAIWANGTRTLTTPVVQLVAGTVTAASVRCAGILSVTGTTGGTSPYSYNWYYGTSEDEVTTWAGWTTEQQLTIPSLTAETQYWAYVEVTDAAGVKASSSTATLTTGVAAGSAASSMTLGLGLGIGLVRK
jgi:hypothetical protein